MPGTCRDLGTGRERRNGVAIREIPDALMGETYFRIRMRQGKKNRTEEEGA